MKSILFNTEMVEAILSGKKTITRRLVKPQPDEKHQYPLGYVTDSTDKKTIGYFGFGADEYGGTIQYAKPPYKVGDVLYVRETWRCWRAHRYEANADIMFRAGGPGVRLEFANGNTDSINRDDYDTFIHKWFNHDKWRPAIHMPKEVARIFLRVKSIHLEKLQDITEEQAEKEGAEKCIEVIRPDEDSPVTYIDDDGYFVLGFKSLWNSTIKKEDINTYGWDANPYVWVIEFETVKSSIIK